MQQHRDRWWQIRLSSLLVSIALFGVSVAFYKAAGNEGGRYYMPAFLFYAMLCGVVVFSCGAFGALVGRVWSGFLVGLILVCGMLFVLVVFTTRVR